MTPAQQIAALKAENVSLKTEIVTMTKAFMDLKKRFALMTAERDDYRRRLNDLIHNRPDMPDFMKGIFK